ncbi:MAG: hypothetical protein K5657_01980 [Desulfovibrio sp.]|nr:hypothetical protein [Desulfovibrio sp.]
MSNEAAQELISMWRPSTLPVLQKVHANKVPLTLLLSHGFSGKSLAVQLKGQIVHLANTIARLVILEQQTVPTTGPAKIAQGQVVADVFFNMTLEKAGGILEPMGYNGEANILQTVTDSDGKPTELLLRFGRDFNTRRMRRDARFDWKPDIPATLGLDIVDQIPISKLELKDILSNCVNNRNVLRFSILNISAGGVCFKIPPHATKSAASALFFFLLCINIKGRAEAFFLLAKKLGLHYAQQSKEADGFRMQFTHELDMSKSQTKLFWNDIEKTGSSRLRNTLNFLMGTSES